MTEPANKKDDIVADLLKVMAASRNKFAELEDSKLMANLVTYIVARDHKVFNHAYNLGREAAKWPKVRKI